MSDPGAIPLGLMQQQAARPINPEELETMGKRAAAQYACGTPLSDAVVEIVKEARLSPEQVKRVCEFANTNAYLSAFEKAGSVRNITFEGGPADPGKVLRDLNDGSAPAINQVESEDYAAPSGTYKTASVNNDHLLAEMFGAGGMEKAASVDHSARANATEEVYDLRTQLNGQREHFMSKLSSSDVLLNDVRDDVCSTATQEVLSGSSSLGDIARAWSSYAPSAEFLKEAMVLVGSHLRSRGWSQEKLAGSLTKTAQAGSVPNPQHPLIERFIAFAKVASEHRRLEEAIRVTDEQLEQANNRLRSYIV